MNNTLMLPGFSSVPTLLERENPVAAITDHPVIALGAELLVSKWLSNKRMEIAAGVLGSIANATAVGFSEWCRSGRPGRGVASGGSVRVGNVVAEARFGMWVIP